MQSPSYAVRSDTGRLAATYFAIIFGLTLVFSGIIYAISSSQFDRPITSRFQNGDMSQFDDSARSSLQDLFDERARQARGELLLSLLFLNMAVLISGAFFSYFLARKTLEPIEAAMRSQSQFVSDASHELRTPLAALQVTNEVALRKKKLTLANAKELIGYNLAETIKLRDLSEALLGLARHGNADVSKAPVNLAETVLEVIKTLQPLADQKHISITRDVPTDMVEANQSAVTQILRVFIDNAIKYSPQSSVVHISSLHGQSGTTIVVKDAGQGIAPEHHQKIFDRFYRVDQSRSSQNVQGAGLGLAIAKTIADRNGYDIELWSEPGKGTEFHLQLG